MLLIKVLHDSASCPKLALNPQSIQGLIISNVSTFFFFGERGFGYFVLRGGVPDNHCVSHSDPLGKGTHGVILQGGRAKREDRKGLATGKALGRN